MQKIKNPSLEFNWLPNSFLKGLVLPELYVGDSGRYGGMYTHISDKFPHGRIIINPVDREDSESFRASLAHEIRHAWQEQNGWEMVGSDWPGIIARIPYEKAIVKYFTTYAHEMDALQFEYKHAKYWGNEEWMQWIKEKEKSFYDMKKVLTL